MISLATVVQHHPARTALLPALLEGLAGLEVEVVEDPGGVKPDTWRTHRACLEAMPAESSHLLVIQDDALPCARFAERITEAVGEHPDSILAAFVPGFPFLSKRLAAAQTRGEAFAVLLPAAFVPLVAVVYPRNHVEGLLAYTDGSQWPRARRMGTADDAIVAGYVRANRLSVVATCQSLADHRDDVESIAKPSHRAGKHRRAALFAD